VALTAIVVVTLIVTYIHTPKVAWTHPFVARPSSEKGLDASDLAALAEALNGASAPRTVLVYPDPASPIAERVGHETVSLVLGKERTPAAIRGALGMALPPSGFVDLVIAGARDDGTTRQVRAVIEQTLYHLYRPSGQAYTETYGSLERSTFLVGPADIALEPIGAVFEGGIELVAGGALDDPEPGVPLRMAFDWRVREPVSDSLAIFVHLVRDDVRLFAQRDAIPGNGLFPVAEWSAGELMRDQFALLLPPTLPPGEYELRVGIYDANTFERRSLIGAESGTYMVVKQWDIR
jgi:hypothetical protein